MGCSSRQPYCLPDHRTQRVSVGRIGRQLQPPGNMSSLLNPADLQVLGWKAAQREAMMACALSGLPYFLVLSERAERPAGQFAQKARGSTVSMQDCLTARLESSRQYSFHAGLLDSSLGKLAAVQFLC